MSEGENKSYERFQRIANAAFPQDEKHITVSLKNTNKTVFIGTKNRLLADLRALKCDVEAKGNILEYIAIRMEKSRYLVFTNVSPSGEATSGISSKSTS
jgi:hypothetical protein